jgi:CBS domain-containing protein
MAHSISNATLLQAIQQQRALSLANQASVEMLAKRAEVFEVAASTLISPANQQHLYLHLVLEGKVQLEDPDHDIRIDLNPGELFGYGTRASAKGSSWGCTALTPTTLARWTPDVIDQIRHAHPAIAFFLGHRTAKPNTDPGSNTDENTGSGNHLNLMTTPVRSLVKREAITLPPTASIQETAQLMMLQRVSSVLLVEQGHLFGVVTDRDLRNRVVAQGLDIQMPVHEIATLAPMTVEASSPAFDAMLLMARHNIHHVPVVDGTRVLGMITATDLSERNSTSAVYLAGEIYKQTTLDGLIQSSTKVKRLQQNLAAAGASAYSSGHIVTAITDAITIRLLQLGESRFGSAPVDYAWVAAGSQARNEQTAKSDQDNCLILDDRYDPAQHGEYFKTLAKWVCDGLDACGYIHCPGDMMAMNDTWCQPLAQWARYFDRWINTPDPKALMLTCVFFDQRTVYGNADLLTRLRADVLTKTKGNSLFLAHMVGNALKHSAPLGMFGNITLARGGDHPNTIDLKHSGVVPIIDLARVYSLAGGIDAVNTDDRLAKSAASREISPEKSRDLRDALEFISGIRIAHQARQTAAGQKPDNFLSLDELSNFERAHLKDAFQVVKGLQSVLAQRYGGR